MVGIIQKNGHPLDWWKLFRKIPSLKTSWWCLTLHDEAHLTSSQFRNSETVRSCWLYSCFSCSSLASKAQADTLELGWRTRPRRHMSEDSEYIAGASHCMKARLLVRIHVVDHALTDDFILRKHLSKDVAEAPIKAASR